ncbi:transmembrane protein [Trichonephila inaurata madagascariensis]|uniref:Transmembrane protein n=1 Tax=Trichonephila inaurata madagascariensis TaxID=2747483 RepID=A0A8X7CTT4_9ARAC|nr:transmembrane protein [Trichonephila inaurata madagascariensis]
MNYISFSRSTSLYLLFSSVKRTVCKSSGCLLTNKSSRLFLSTEYFPTEKVKSLKQDTLLYTVDKTKLVRYVTIYGIGQFVICMFLGFNVFFSLKDTRSSKISKNDTSDSDEKFWRKRNLGEFKYRIMSGMACCSIGLIAGLICYYLPTRIVKLITLQKGGSTALIVTHGLFGKTRSLKVPLHLLTCTVSRDQAKTYIPIKFKKRWFFYLVDCNGQFHQPALFDVTVGAKNW